MSSRSNVIAATILHLPLPGVRDGIGSSTVGFIDLENRELAVEISFLCATELEICLGSVPRCFTSVNKARASQG